MSDQFGYKQESQDGEYNSAFPENHSQFHPPYTDYQHQQQIGYTYGNTQFPIYSTDQFQQQPQNIHYQQPEQPEFFPPENNTMVDYTPRFVRTSEVRQGTESLGYSGLRNMMYRTGKAELRIEDDLNNITSMQWTMEELSSSRRLVEFERQQEGSEIKVKFRPISVKDYEETNHLVNRNSFCIISCIKWRNSFYLTSVDCILLLEKLIGNKFGTDEKNRIRRNLEGYKPITISKSNIEFEEFFNLIKSYTDPKPINILKDVKVFEWHILEKALEKIISKYSACYDGGPGSGGNRTDPSLLGSYQQSSYSNYIPDFQK